MQFVLIPTWDREGKECANCGSKLGVRYKRKSDNKYFCNMCAMQLITIADYMALGQEPPVEEGENE